MHAPPAATRGAQGGMGPWGTNDGDGDSGGATTGHCCHPPLTCPLVSGIADCLPLPENRGFAYAVNRGIEAADTEFVAVLNNDVTLDPNWLADLEDSLDDGANSYACPLLRTAAQPETADGAYDLLSRSGCALRALHGSPMQTAALQGKRRILFPPMTAALFRRSLFSAIGLLDEAFGSYLEDVEFGLRAARQGHAGIFVPQARATHVGSATLGSWSARATVLIARNQVLLVCRHYPASLLRRWWWPILVGNVLYLLLAMRNGQGIAALRGKAQALSLWSKYRGSSGTAGAPRSAADIQNLVATSEREIAELATTLHPDRFWKVYFKLCPPVAALQNEK